MNLLRGRRAAALAAVLPWCFVRLALLRVRGPLTPERRAEWLQCCCRQVLAAVGLRVRLKGTPPLRGLVVSNHLSYLDVALFSAVMPCVFVSKVQVRRWPYFGRAARAAGTIFLDRASHSSAGAASLEISKRLVRPVAVLLFPEGTSTDGTRVLRFHSALLESAVSSGEPITAASIRYETADRTPERELCWFGDEPFLPHLWKTLGMTGVSAEVAFDESCLYSDRRIAARTAHEQVKRLRASAPCAQ